jgi:hypothetical protein
MMTYKQFKADREARRRAVIGDWWDASVALHNARQAGNETPDDLCAYRVATLNLFTFQAENAPCCVGG